MICKCSSLMPVMTISLVCGSRSRRKVESSSQILCSAPESLPSSPRLLGRGGQADHRRGEGDRRHGQLAQATSRCAGLRPWPRPRSRPGRPRRSARSRSACTWNSAPSLTPLRTPTTGTVESFFSVPEKTRMKLSFCTNGSMRVLNTWATSGPAGSAFTSTSSPAAFFAVRDQRVGRQRTERQGVEQFGQARARLARNAQHRNQRALGHGLDDQPGDFFVGGRRALEIPLHHRFIDLDDRLQQRLADFGRIDQRAGRVGGRLQRAGHAAELGPLAQRHVEQHAALAEQLLNAFDQRGEVDVVGIHPVHDDHPSQAGLLRLVEHAAGVDLDARLGVDDDRRRIDAAHRADRLADEIGIAGRVDHMELLAGVLEMHHARLRSCTCAASLPRRSRRCSCRRRRWRCGRPRRWW